VIVDENSYIISPQKDIHRFDRSNGAPKKEKEKEKIKRRNGVAYATRPSLCGFTDSESMEKAYEVIHFSFLFMLHHHFQVVPKMSTERAIR